MAVVPSTELSPTSQVRRGGPRSLVLTILGGFCAFAGIAFYLYSGRIDRGDSWAGVGDADRAFYIPRLVVDGSPTEWAKCPVVPFGYDTATERLLAGSTRVGWTEQGLALSIAASIRDPSAAALRPDGDQVDLFIDLRPEGARLERYEQGVYHIAVRPMADGKHASFLEIVPRNARLKRADLSACQGVFSPTPDGWTLELLIPWLTLGAKARHTGDWIPLSYRVTHLDLKTRAEVVGGSEDVEPKNRLQDAPMAFSPVLLSDERSIEMPEVCYRADETVINGAPCLQVNVIAPITDTLFAISQLHVDARSADTHEGARFRGSIGGKFWIATCRFPLRGLTPADRVLSVDLSVRDGSRTIWRRTARTICRASAATAQIESSVSDASINRLPDREKSMAYMLKACAIETADLLAFAPDGFRAPRRRLRALFDEHLYDRRIHLFLDFAADLAAGKRLAPHFPYVAFKSRIDGEWIPLKIVLPWNYTPDRRYGACIYLYGKAQHHSRADFIESDLAAITRSQYVGPLGDTISIIPYMRSDRSDELERETLEYIFQFVLPELHADPARVGVYGGSAGGAQALDLAVHHPDRFAWVLARAGDFGHYLNLPEGPTDELKNLLGCAVNLQSGDTDVDITSDNRELFERLKRIGIQVVYDELPDTKHQFAPLALPVSIQQHSLNLDPDAVSIAFTNPAYGTAFWISGQQVEHWGVAANIEARWSANELKVETSNVSRLIVRKKDGHFPEKLIVDSRPVPWRATSRDTAEIQVQKSDAGWTIGSDAGQHWKKIAGRCGPAAQIECGPLAIVYGTKSESYTPYLRERAFRIVRARIGPADDQLGTGQFRILSDVEAMTASLQGVNVWLIGSAQQNAYVAQLAHSLPVADDSARAITQFGSDSILSYLYPKTDDKVGYYYVEIGTSPTAYFLDCVPSAQADMSIRIATENGAVTLREASFDTFWNLPGR